MTEQIWWWSGRAYIPRSKYNKMMKELKKSYKKADELAKRSEQEALAEGIKADIDLDKQLEDI